MDGTSLAIANPVFSDQVAGQLIKSGETWQILIAVVFMIMQVIIFPSVIFMVKWLLALRKKQDEIETENRKLHRDEQISGINHRMDMFELQHNNDIKLLQQEVRGGFEMIKNEIINIKNQ